MSHTIVLPSEFDDASIKFLAPRQNKLGGQSVLINYETDQNSGAFILQTSRVRIPFGIDQSKPQNGEAVKYHISIALANDETQNPQLRQFTENIRALDNKAKTHAMEESAWFGKKLSQELVNEFYKSAEKFPKDKDSKWPSNLKVKLPFSNGVPQFAVYDENKNPVNVVDEDGNIDLSSIPRGSEAVCLIQSTGVWFVGKTQFGVGFKLLQAKIFKSNKLSGYSIVDSEEEEDVESEENQE
tara:strand:+ start:2033 stop:2755 length:723 start_codon:yes stop_codon:yes gene_type:complete